VAKPTKHYGMWRIRWVDENRCRHSEVYEKRDDAVFRLREHEQKVAEIKRGRRLPDPPPKKFEEVDAYWMRTRAAGKRSRACDESLLRAHLRPAFSGKVLSEIRKVEIDSFVASKAHLHKNTRHHILTLLVSLLSQAIELGWLRSLPKIEKPKLKLFSRDLHYLRSGEERDRFLRAASDQGELGFALYATAHFTGMRQGELAGLRWSEVDLEKRLIIVAHSWDGPPKNGDPRPVLIVDALLPIMASWRLRSSSPFVFPNRDGAMFSKCARVFQESFHATLDRAGFPMVERHGRLRRYIRFHDLRHSFATAWILYGGDFFKLQQILGHASPQMTMRYAHFAPSAFAADYGRFGEALILGDALVVPFPVVSAGV
jgi:integrase